MYIYIYIYIYIFICYDCFSFVPLPENSYLASATWQRPGPWSWLSNPFHAIPWHGHYTMRNSYSIGGNSISLQSIQYLYTISIYKISKTFGGHLTLFIGFETHFDLL